MTSVGNAFLAAGLVIAAASGVVAQEPTVISGAGFINPLIEQFRTELGANNANMPAQRNGRREVNWDGISDERAAPAFLPSDVFKVRGMMLATPGEGVQASARKGNAEGTLPYFGNINPTYVDVFNHFSAERLFSPVGSNAVDVTFVMPGTDRPAVSRGFGAVYVDVDQEHTAFEFFDANDNSLGKYNVPANDGGFSFLGVVFERPVVARVHIDYGTDAIGPDDDADNDVAVMDDFIYGEPLAR